MKKSVARILGCLLTDGSVMIRSGNRGVIQLANRSEQLRRNFAEALKETYSLTSSDDGFLCRAFSIATVKKLLKYSPTFRKKKYKRDDGKIEYPSTIIPKEIMEADEGTICEFLKYVFSCDGSAQLSVLRQKNRWFFQKRVQLACSHPILLSQYQELLLKIGIYSRKELKENRLVIDSRENLEKFIKKISFVDGVKISGKGGSCWKGLEKNQLLKIISYLYEVYDSLGVQRFSGGFWNKNFKNKSEIIKFLNEKASS